MTRLPQIILIEDDHAQQTFLHAALGQRGYGVEVAGSGREALHLAGLLKPDVVILDLGLPDVDGLVLCRHLRILVACPIIVVTADSHEDRIVKALDIGADDYIVKPFSVSVLAARIRVALRHGAETAAIVDDELLEAGDVQVDVAAHQVSVGGTILELQARQFSFLVALIRNPGKLLTYATLAKALGGPHEQDDDRNSWRILASKVRKQLGEGPLRPMIETERNVGYRLVVPATDQPIAGTG